MNLVVIHLMDPLRPSLGGAVRHVLYLLKYFLERGYKITFIGTQDDKNYPPDKLLYEYYKSRKLSIIYLSRGYGVFKFFIGLVVASIMLDISPETIIHFHQPYFILPFILHRKCKLVLTLHALPLHTLKIGHKFMFCFFKPI
ncbi:MAG: glycosyltransferase, partial [Nitrososphaeria archaeon]